MLESLDLVKPDLPAKPKRLWTKKIWKRNESRGLRTRVFCHAADQTDWRPRPVSGARRPCVGWPLAAWGRVPAESTVLRLNSHSRI